MHTQERRSAKRFPLDLTGCVFIKGNNIELKTHDVSEVGALVELVTPAALKKGARLQIRLNIGFSGRAVVCRVNARDNCTLYSLKFDRFDYFSDLMLSAYLIKHDRYLLETPTTIH